MPLDSKMEYTQADGALTLAKQAVTFSIDGTIEVKPNGVVIKNTDTSGAKVVQVCINSGDTVIATLAFGEKCVYSIKKIKQLQLGRTAAGAPNFTVKAAR